MKEAMRIDKESLGENHPDYGTDLNNLAQLYQDMGRYEQAEPLMKEAMRIDKESLGENHPDYSIRLNNLAQIYLAMGRYEQAGPLMKESFRIFQYQVKNNTGFLSEKELEEFLNTILHNLEIYQSFNILRSIKDSMNNSGDFAFDIELDRKGILLQAAQHLRNHILESGDTALINSFNKLLSLRKQIEKLYSLDSAKRYVDPVKLEQRANELEKDLALKSQDYTKSIEEVNINWIEIQKQLKPDEAVIEFSSFRIYDKRWTDSTYYCALVLRPEYTVPKMVFLFEERDLSNLLNTTGKDIHQLYASTRGVEPLYTSNDSSYQSESLYRLIFKPIDSLLNGVKTIYYVPSGLLYRISFPAIAVNPNERLTDRYNLSCLSSSKKLVTNKQEEQLFTNNRNTIALFGGINYEWNSNQPQRLQKTAGGELLALRGTWLPEDKTRNETFSYLPGTLEEVKSIDKQCQKHQVKDNLYTADLATEAQFKSLSGINSPAIIHLSTHGFFFSDTTNESRKNHMMNSNEQSYRYSKDPLLRSGLALAGANRAWSGEEIPEGMENGILQAKEVSNMDLRNTKLVVLSACETGLGDIKGSEGVFGLQRSFKMAGVDYLLMSLWQVPDEATQKLMTMFYENLFNGQQIREAFKNAQIELRHLKKEYEDPFYWAAWVLVE
jgi:CHAT domain-containing protein